MQRLELVRVADSVCVFSESVGADVESLTGVQPDLIHHCRLGPSRDSLVSGSAVSSAVADRAEHSLVAVLGEDPRKNFDRLVAAYGSLPLDVRSRMPLLVCGMNVNVPRRLPSGVQLLQRLDETEMGDLQRRCRATIHPATDEGFGLPALDGLSAGGATIVSDIPVLAKLVPDADARFDPLSVDSIAGAISRLADDQFVDRLRSRAGGWAAQHNWEAAAADLFAAHDAALLRVRRPLPRKPRLAFITPFPPQRTGVATFEQRRLKALAGIADVDVFTRRPDDLALTPVEGLRIYDAESIPASTALEHGGDVVLHDVRLDGLYKVLVGLGLAEPGDLDSATGLMCGQVIDAAQRILVHSEGAKAMVVSERPLREADVHVIPFFVGAPPETNNKSGSSEVAAFGFVKDPELLVAVFARLLAIDASLRLLIVGGLGSQHVAVMELLSANGIDDAVVVTEWLEEDDWNVRLREASVAVQLRGTWNGESSSSVAACLAAGVPTVVNDLGAFDAIPESALLKLSPEESAATIAEHVHSLLGDDARRRSMASAALEFAARGTEADCAAGLLSALGLADGARESSGSQSGQRRGSRRHHRSPSAAACDNPNSSGRGAAW